jgi:hypothetical protein
MPIVIYRSFTLLHVKKKGRRCGPLIWEPDLSRIVIAPASRLRSGIAKESSNPTCCSFLVIPVLGLVAARPRREHVFRLAPDSTFAGSGSGPLTGD